MQNNQIWCDPWRLFSPGASVGHHKPDFCEYGPENIEGAQVKRVLWLVGVREMVQSWTSTFEWFSGLYGSR